jgi:NHLM bacteriocin system ABC transporter ATP-binding protein
VAIVEPGAREVEPLLEGTSVPMQGSRPVVLDEPGLAYLVRGGPVQVFALERVGEHHGLRFPLFSASPGELLVGIPPAALVGPDSGVAESARSGGAAGAKDARDPRGTEGEGGGGSASGGHPRVRMELGVAGLGESEELLVIDRRLVSEESVPAESLGALAALLERFSAALGEAAEEASSVGPTQAFATEHRHLAHHRNRMPGEGGGVRKGGEGGSVEPAGYGESRPWQEAWDEAVEAGRAVLTFAIERLESSTAEAHERLRRLDQHHLNLRSAAYADLSEVVRGTSVTSRLDVVAGDPLVAALRVVARASGIDLADVPSSFPRSGLSRDPRELVEDMALLGGFRTRRVSLKGAWWKEDAGPLLAWTLEDRRPVALLPSRPGRYRFVDPRDEGSLEIDAALAELVHPEAIALVRVLPAEKVSRRRLVAFGLGGSSRDLARVLVIGAAMGALSLVPPFVARTLFDTVVPLGDASRLVGLASLLLAAAVCRGAFSFVQALSASRVEGRIESSLQPALFARLLDLPASFYRRFGSADLALRAMSAERLSGTVGQLLLVAVVSVFVAVLNVMVLYVIQPTLALFATAAVVAMVLTGTWLLRAQIDAARQLHESNGRLLQVAVGLVGGLPKLRVAHAEDRAFAQWAARFGEMKRAGVRTQRGGVRLATASAIWGPLATALVLVGAALLPVGKLQPGTFLSFNTAFTEVLVSALALVSLLAVAATAAPLYERVRPIVEALPERAAHHSDPGELRGLVEAIHVSFRYSEDDPLVLDDVSLVARPGEMVALVGPSGSGKSSLLRVLLGFESPELGMVVYDGQDLASLDARALRRQLGVVTQGGMLLPDDVLHNIVGGRRLSMDDAWEAAEIAGIADFIRSLPMGMHTFVAEGAGSFSGGQRQALLIARAVAGRPKVLFFDEATSSLDNLAQARVMQNIAAMNCTRVVIAHRLSTVEMADSIVVLVGGRVVETGSYGELMSARGTFWRLASRQLA